MTKPPESQTTPQTVYIEYKLFKTIGVSVNGDVKQVPVDGMGNGAIGVMIVYEKIPKGRKKEEFEEAWLWKIHKPRQKLKRDAIQKRLKHGNGFQRTILLQLYRQE